MLSASANKLSKLKERAAEYASLIMEELDPECLGYIEVTFYSSISKKNYQQLPYTRDIYKMKIIWLFTTNYQTNI